MATFRTVNIFTPLSLGFIVDMKLAVSVIVIPQQIISFSLATFKIFFFSHKAAEHQRQCVYCTFFILLKIHYGS